MSKNILKALFLLSIVSMVFVGGDVLATSCAYPLPVWGTWPAQSMSDITLFCGTSSDILITRYNNPASNLGRMLVDGGVVEGMIGVPTINSTVYPYTGRYPMVTHFIWQCSDSNNSNPVLCNGGTVYSACGSSAGGSFNSAPVTNLCTTGTASNVNYTVGMRIQKESGYEDYSYVYYWKCTNPGSTGDETYCFARANQAPIANAGTDKTVNEGQQVTLSDATASDYHNDTLSYSWSCTGGSLSSSTILNPIFTAPSVSTNTNYTCTLTVNDGNGKTANDSVVITVTNIPVNGSCGTAQGHGYQSTSYIDTSAERCAAGTFSGSFVDNGSYWSWSCIGIDGGTTASCSANKVATGSYHNTTRRDQPSTNLCAYGTPINFQLIGDIWYWSCTNNPGVDAAGYTYKTTCGSSNGGSFSSESEITNLCEFGQPSLITTNPSTYTWTCTGDDSLAVSCSATRTTSVNGDCGTAQGHGYYSTSSIDTSIERCEAGTFSGSFIDNGSYWSWTCSGSGGGSDANCSANKVATGSYHNTTRRDQPSTNLCAYGTPINFQLIGDIWYWSCTNNPGVDAAGYTYKTTCGSSNGGSFSSESEITNLCEFGQPSLITTNPSTYTWTCTGDDSLAVSCSATRTTSVNGDCGTAQGQLYSSVPSSLCDAGTEDSFTTNATTYTWTCKGSEGGSDANCSSNRISFKNPYDINNDESCWFCEHYYDGDGILRDGELSSGMANLQFKFTTNASDYNSYKLAIGTINDVAQAMQTDEWLSVSSSETTFSGAKVIKSGTDQKNGSNGFYLTYGNGTSGKTYYWWVKLRKPDLTESEWMYGGTIVTPEKAFPVVRVAADKETVTVGTDIQYCTTLTDLQNTNDPCYPVCWTGTGDPVVDPDNANWKCSVCYNSSNQPVPCTTANDNAFSWVLPEQSGSYMETTNALSANPIFRFSTTVQNAKPGLAVSGSECASEGETGTKAPLPQWREVAP